MQNLPVYYTINEDSLVQKNVMKVINEAEEYKGIKIQAKDRVYIESPLIDLNWKNRNGRMYLPKDFLPALKDERLLELLRTCNLFGESDHPLDASLKRQATIKKDNASHIILKVWADGDVINGIIRASDIIPIGDSFNNSILNGVIPSFSLRALGGLKETKKGMCATNLRIITWDWVVYPSHKKAYMTKKISDGALNNIKESSGIKRISESSIINFIKDESKNVKLITNLLEYAFDSVSLSNDKKFMILENNNEKIHIKLENYVLNQIYNNL